MDILNIFHEKILQKMNHIAPPEKTAINDAADKIHKCIVQNHRTYFFGTNHAYLLEQEKESACFTFLHKNKFLPEYLFEKLPGKKASNYAHTFLKLYAFQEGDVIVITSNSGHSAFTAELALQLKNKGIAVIAISSLKYSRATEDLNKNQLAQTAHIALDSRSEYENCFVLHCVIASFIQKQLNSGIHCPIFKSRKFITAQLR